jgi:hypothetical protein
MLWTGGARVSKGGRRASAEHALRPGGALRARAGAGDVGSTRGGTGSGGATWGKQGRPARGWEGGGEAGEGTWGGGRGLHMAGRAAAARGQRTEEEGGR